MNKYYLTLIFTLLFSFANLFAADDLITYEDFVHFNYEQKTKTVKMIHQFLITYEKLPKSKTNKQTKINREKYKRYSKLFNLIISNAYAQGSFSKSLSGKIKENLCFYGGWLSFTKSNGKCSHPNQINFGETQKQIKAAAQNGSEVDQQFVDYFEALGNKYTTYKDSQAKNATVINFKNGRPILEEQSTAKVNCSSPGMLLCNPTIYGTDPRADTKGQSFCVSGNVNLGLNSSLMCSMAKDALSQDEDKKELSLDIFKRAEQNAPDNEFFYLLRSMYDTCLCSGNTPEGTPEVHSGMIKKSYAKKLYYHRTCIGILHQTKQITNAFKLQQCRVIKDHNISLGDTDSESWSSFLNRANNILFKKANYTMLMNRDVYQRAEEFELKLNSSSNSPHAQSPNDNYEFKREGHIDGYIKQKLCPIGSFTPPPAVTPLPEAEPREQTTEDKDYKLIVATKDKEKGIVEVAVTIQVIKGEKLNDTATISLSPKTEGAQALKNTNSPKVENNQLTYLYDIVKTDKEQPLIATGSFDNWSKQEEIKIAPIEKEKTKYDLKISVDDKAGDDTTSIATVTLTAPEDVKLDATAKIELKASEELTIKSIDSSALTNSDDPSIATTTAEEEIDQGTLDDEPGESSTDGTDTEGSKNTLVQKFEIQKLDREVPVVATTSVDDSLQANAKIPAHNKSNPKDQENDNSCNAELALNKEDKSLTLSYSYGGVTHSLEQAGTFPDGVSASVKWYDSMVGEKADEQAIARTKNTLASLDSASDDNPEETVTEGAETIDRAIAAIKDNIPLNDDEKLGQSLIYDFSTKLQTRIVAVTVEFSKDSKVICKAADAQIKERVGKSPQNNSPVQLNGAPRMIKGQGQVLGGQR